LSDPQSILWYLPLLLYAETHYRFRFFFSYLKKNEPEILADAPHRLEPGTPLPLLILAKDAHRYPCALQNVRIEIRQGSKREIRNNALEGPQPLAQPLWWRIVPLDVTSWSGWIELTVLLTIERQGKAKTYSSDNHRTSSGRPLRVFVSENPLPRFANLYLGDAHTHSSYTDDQVEFGSPMKAALGLCRSMGLSFFCVTDHSYDLDDHAHSYLVNHPELPKWKAFQEEVNELNEGHDGFAVVRGEEASCRNGVGKNVHLLLYGTRQFFAGSGDGAERWLRTRSEHSIAEIIQQKGMNVAAYAAHAHEHVPYLQRLLLGRDTWSDQDLQTEGLQGIQFLNGKIDDGFRSGKEAWVRALLRGKRLFAVAGNDAHGNFNRFRQIGIPFLGMRETDEQIFGKMRSGVFLQGPLTEASVVEALRDGNAIVSDGPVVHARLVTSDGTITPLGGTARSSEAQLRFTALSSQDYGEITSLRVLLGEIRSSEEKTVVSFNDRMGFEVQKQVSIRPRGACYVRIEAETSRQNLLDQQAHWCFTNPIWVSP